MLLFLLAVDAPSTITEGPNNSGTLILVKSILY